MDAAAREQVFHQRGLNGIAAFLHLLGEVDETDQRQIFWILCTTLLEIGDPGRVDPSLGDPFTFFEVLADLLSQHSLTETALGMNVAVLDDAAEQMVGIWKKAEDADAAANPSAEDHPLPS